MAMSSAGPVCQLESSPLFSHPFCWHSLLWSFPLLWRHKRRSACPTLSKPKLRSRKPFSPSFRDFQHSWRSTPCVISPCEVGWEKGQCIPFLGSSNMVLQNACLPTTLTNCLKTSDCCYGTSNKFYLILTKQLGRESLHSDLGLHMRFATWNLLYLFSTESSFHRSLCPSN